MTTYSKPAIDLMIERAKAFGWNAAIEKAAEICDEFARRDHVEAVTVCDLAATDIRMLTKKIK